MSSVIDEFAEMYKDREALYGHPGPAFKRLTEAAAVLGIGPEKGELNHALYMILLKITRLQESPDHRDSLLDIVGYVRTYEQCLEDGWRD